MVYKEFDLLELAIQDEDIYTAMGYRNQLPDQEIRELVSLIQEETGKRCIPCCMYQIMDCSLQGASRLRITGQEFSLGGIISSYLPGISQSCLFIATAGKEYEAYLHEIHAGGDIVKEFVADAIGSVIAEACVGEIAKELDLRTGFKHTLPYSPGYCGWNIQEQRKLFDCFPDTPCGVTLTDSCLMSPVKSISGFFGLGKTLQPQPYRCEICKNTHCFKRAPAN